MRKRRRKNPDMGGTKRLVANLSLFRSMQSAHGVAPYLTFENALRACACACAED